jgi:hypothetical protein
VIEHPFLFLIRVTGSGVGDPGAAVAVLIMTVRLAYPDGKAQGEFKHGTHPVFIADRANQITRTYLHKLEIN